MQHLALIWYWADFGLDSCLNAVTQIYLASVVPHSGSSLWGLYLLPVLTVHLLHLPLWPPSLPETPLPALPCKKKKKNGVKKLRKQLQHRYTYRNWSVGWLRDNDVLLAPDVINRAAQVMWSVCKGTVGAVFAAVAFCICFVDTWSRLVVAEMISALCVTCCPM